MSKSFENLSQSRQRHYLRGLRDIHEIENAPRDREAINQERM